MCKDNVDRAFDHRGDSNDRQGKDTNAGGYSEATSNRPQAVAPMRDIGWAIKQMWHGQKVTRRGWNGRGMYLALQTPDAHSKMSLPYVFMRTVQGDLVPWLCSQTDLLATDWQMFEAF